MHYIIDSAYIDGTMARRLMQAAASADQPGAHGMSGVEGASPRDREWVLVQVCIHEASHATVAERYGHPAAVRIERGAGFGSGLCMVRGLTDAPHTVRRQIGLAGILGDLFGQHGSALTLQVAVDAVRRGPMSATDLHLMDGTATSQEIAICMRRIESQWGDVIARSKELLATELRYYEGCRP